MKFTAQTNVFLQSFDSTNAATFDPYAVNNHLGLGVSGGGWPKFGSYVTDLNKAATNGTTYKVLFLSREGQTWADVAASQYGQASWETMWSREPGDGKTNWLDAGVTGQGVQQGWKAQTAWQQELASGLPKPNRYYLSPLTRSIQTYELTWPLPPVMNSYIPPMVTELLRETYGIYTPDQRSNLTSLKAAHPRIQFENGFSETDQLWKTNSREGNDQHDTRTVKFLEQLWSESGNDTYISITTNPGSIDSFLRVTNHRAFATQPGGLIPLLILAEPKGVTKLASGTTVSGAAHRLELGSKDSPLVFPLLLGLLLVAMVRQWRDLRQFMA